MTTEYSGRLFETLCEYLLESIFNTDDIGFQYMHGRWWYVYVWISDNYGFEFFEGLKGYSVKGTLTNTLGWGGTNYCFYETV